MTNEAQMKKVVSVLERIADALETIAAAVDEDDDFNVYVRGEVNTDVEEEEED